MKKIVVIFAIILSIFTCHVSAKEIYFTNKHNVSFTKEEYDFISKLMFEGYQEYITKEEFEKIFVDNTLNAKIQTIELEDNPIIAPLAESSHTTQSKKLTMKSACIESSCLISTRLEWLKLPIVRAYDVIGARFEGATTYEDPFTSVIFGTTETVFNNIQKQNKGFGVSVKIPTGTNTLVIIQTFRVYNQGTVYVSYQHARKSISLANSQKYTINASGYGGVFLFDTLDIREHYDAMQGVSLTF